MQQVNLYRRLSVQERAAQGLLTAKPILIMLALILLSLAAFSGYGSWRLGRLEQNLSAMQQRSEEQVGRLELQAATTGGRSTADINKSLATLTTGIVQREKALRALESGEAGEPEGFAKRLEALARSHQDGLWLDGVAFESRDRSVALRGRALRPALVPQYLEGLAHEPALAGTRFGHMTIDRVKDEASVKFVVAAQAPSLEEAQQGAGT